MYNTKFTIKCFAWLVRKPQFTYKNLKGVIEAVTVKKVHNDRNCVIITVFWELGGGVCLRF